MNNEPERSPSILEYIVVIIMIFFAVLAKLIPGVKPKEDAEEN